jgi:ATP-dependent DNA ligase
MRKGLLAELLDGAAGGIVYADHPEGSEGIPIFEAACKIGLEGIVSKRRDKAHKTSQPSHRTSESVSDVLGLSRLLRFVGWL